MEEMERRGKNIRAAVRAEFTPKGIHLLTGKWCRALVEWYNQQVPVLGFNWGRYDQRTFRRAAVGWYNRQGQGRKKREHDNVHEDKQLRFVHIIDYLDPGTTNEKWVKAYAYGCSVQKSWFPYRNGFDSPEKLNYPRLPFKIKYARISSIDRRATELVDLFFTK